MSNGTPSRSTTSTVMIGSHNKIAATSGCTTSPSVVSAGPQCPHSSAGVRQPSVGPADRPVAVGSDARVGSVGVGRRSIGGVGSVGFDDQGDVDGRAGGRVAVDDRAAADQFDQGHGQQGGPTRHRQIGGAVGVVLQLVEQPVGLGFDQLTDLERIDTDQIDRPDG